METDDSDSDTYREIYGVQLLDDIHNYLPAILYNHQRFRTIGDLLGYVRSRAEELNGYQFHETQAVWARRRRERQERLLRRLQERQNMEEEEEVKEEESEEEPVEESQRNPFLANIFQPQSLLSPFILPHRRLNSPTIVEALLQLATPELQSTHIRSRWPSSPYGFSTAASATATASTTQNIPPNFFDPVPIFPTAEQLEAASLCLTADISATEQVCTICQENYRVGEEQRFLLYCGHFFHVRCVDRWFESNVRCPLCRHDIRGDVPSPTSDVSGNVDSRERHQYETIIHAENGVVQAFTFLSSAHNTNDDAIDDIEDNSYSESEGG